MPETFYILSARLRLATPMAPPALTDSKRRSASSCTCKMCTALNCTPEAPLEAALLLHISPAPEAALPAPVAASSAPVAALIERRMLSFTMALYISMNADRMRPIVLRPQHTRVRNRRLPRSPLAALTR